MYVCFFDGAAEDVTYKMGKMSFYSAGCTVAYSILSFSKYIILSYCHGLISRLMLLLGFLNSIQLFAHCHRKY